MNISVIGAGYVGLVTGACFAELGHRVTVYDIDKDKVARLEEGIVPFYELGLQDMVLRTVRDGRLCFTADPQHSVEGTDIVFICVGTPPCTDGSADLRQLYRAVDMVARFDYIPTVLVIKSTVPIGTAELVKQHIQHTYGKDLVVLSNPEFLREGSAVHDCLYPDRIVLGGPSDTACQVLVDLYATTVRTGRPVFVMDNRSAEAAKYAANCMLATRISFMNELSRICEKYDADVEKVRRSMGADDRIGPKFLFPGIGYGGSCFPKDVRALAAMGEESAIATPLLNAVTYVNDTQWKHFGLRISEHYASSTLSGKRLAVWGLSFKPHTDDVREAPALKLIPWLQAQGASITAFDPQAMGRASDWLYEAVTYGPMYDCCKDADGLVICTEWEMFRNPDFTRLGELLAKRVIFDGRNLYDPKQMAALDFTYISVGRPVVVQGK